MKEKSCGAIIFNGNKFLILHYASGHFEFAKGHIMKGETEEETALREIKEETGLDVEILPGFHEIINYFYKHEGKTIDKDVVFFLARSKTNKVKLSSEHIGYSWLSFEEARKQVTFKNSKKLLDKAFALLSKEGIL